jgi:hypothetical protein
MNKFMTFGIFCKYKNSEYLKELSHEMYFA